MKYFLNHLFISFSLLIKLVSSQNDNTNSDVCTLTRQKSSDPFPSLSKCYKYNNEACCMSVHDDYIENYVSSILSPSCIRKYTLCQI